MRSFASRYASNDAVPVEVVGLEVEEHADVARERVYVLELEATTARRRPRPGWTEATSRAAHVPGDRDVAAGRSKIAPRSAVVVVFPFVPVTPTSRSPGSSR